MSLGTSMLVLLAFGVVLALLGFSARLLRRFAGGVTLGRSAVPLEVVQRVALGPKQGIALVRIGERVVAVSMGEGGVRRLMELPEEECALLSATPSTPVVVPSIPDLRALLSRVVRPAAMVLLLASAALVAPTAAAAQAGVAGVRAPVAASAAAAQAPTMQQIDNALPKLAPQIDLRVGQPGDGSLRLSGTVGVVIMMGLLTLLPTLILSMTSFTRILIVLHFLRQAIGTTSAPPSHLVGALALLLTGFVMAPTLGDVNRTALQPWMNGQMSQGEMLVEGAKPFRAFMARETRDRDIATFLDLSQTPAVASIDQVPLVVLVSAFVTSELRTAFQIGFALFLPFIIIDIVVASVLMSMGMFMLPPAMIALPFKLLLFVLVDGWTLIVQGLITSFH